MALDLRLRASFIQCVAILELACQVLVVNDRWVLNCLWSSLAHVHARTSIPLPREAFNLSFDGLVDEMLVLRVSRVLASVGTYTPRHRLTLIDTRCRVLLPIAKVSRLGK